MFSSWFFLGVSKPAFHHFMELWLQLMCFNFLFFYSTLDYNIDLNSKVTPDTCNCKNVNPSVDGEACFYFFTLFLLL